MLAVPSRCAGRLPHLTAGDVAAIDAEVRDVLNPVKGHQMSAYFRDETVWRGRMLAAMCELRRAVFELGFWVSAMYLGFSASKWWAELPVVIGGAACVRFLGAMWEEFRSLRTIDHAINRFAED